MTYETAHAIGVVIEGKETYSMIQELVIKDFGQHMDNKITLCYNNEDRGMLFITYWDSKIYISGEATLWADISKSGSNYRCIPPQSLKMTTKECVDNLLTHWIPKESFAN